MVPAGSVVPPSTEVAGSTLRTTSKKEAGPVWKHQAGTSQSSVGC